MNMDPVSEVGRARRSEDATPTTAKNSRGVSDRLADSTVSKFKFHSVRHTLAAIPQTRSPRSKSGESGVVIEERRLMAPIDPPLPRSTVIGLVPNTSSDFTSPYEISPRTPNFMRPTSSSAARRTQISKSFKAPPPPLNLTGGSKTDDMFNSFGRHRERKRAQAQLGDRGISYGNHLGFLPAKGPQMMTTHKQNAVVGQPVLLHETEKPMQARHKAAKEVTSPKVPDPTSSEEADFNQNSPRPYENMLNPTLYPRGLRYASSPELRAAFASEEPPLPKIPQQFIVKQDRDTIRQQVAAATAQKEPLSTEQVPHHGLHEDYHAASRVRPSVVAPHRVLEQGVPGGSGPNKPTNNTSGGNFRNVGHSSNGRQLPPSRLPRSTSEAVSPQQPASEHHAPPTVRQCGHASTKGSPSSAEPLPTMAVQYPEWYENDVGRMNWEREQARLKNESKFSPRKAQRKIVQLYRSNFSSVELGNYVNRPPADAVEDFTLVNEAQDLLYWAGRFSANNDRLRNDALNSSVTYWARDDAARHNEVLHYLQGKCTTMDAEKSLAAFVGAWRQGWSGGVAEACRATVDVVPRQLQMPVEGGEKKKGLIGKVFGRK
ncbi:MAG: hypothetical protein Q9211_000322 [Gyalolechia sp. 1 TL-2023]